MKKIYFLIIQLLFALNIYSQQVTKAEYFVDSDLGPGHNNPITFSADSAVSLNNIPINTTDLALGYHWLFVRAKDVNGVWGACRNKRFYVYNNNFDTPINQATVLTNAEYFIDTDLGPGLNNAITVSADSAVSLNVSINTTNLMLGYHWLFVRVKDANGVWGACRSKRFYVFDNNPISPVGGTVLTNAEYWIDADPVPGTGNIITLNPTDTIFYNDSIPGLHLDSGRHNISVRVKDSREQWSYIKTDSVRTEYYDVDVQQTSNYFIRQGAITKLEVQIKNRSTIELAEQYLFIKSPKFFEIEFENKMDSIDGTYVGSISKGVQYGFEYVVPIWLGKLDPQSIKKIDFYLKYPVVDPHEKIYISTEVNGDYNSVLQRKYNNTHSDSLFYSSLYSSSLISAINILKDTIGINSVIYDVLVDSLKAWTSKNHNIFNNAISLNFLSKAFLQNKFNLSLDTGIINLINKKIFNLFTSKSFNSGRVPNVTNNSFSLNQKSITSGCNCVTPLNTLGAIYGPPLEPVSLFKISRACIQSCECRCDGAWKRKEEQHEAVDIYYEPDPTKECEIPVHAILDGWVSGYVDEFGGYGKKVESVINGDTIAIYYHHLCNVDVNCNLCEYVITGNIIGKIGTSGLSTGPHLHIDIEDNNGQAVSPFCYQNLWSYYQSDITAFVDQKCKPLVKEECKKEVETVSCVPNSLEIAYNGTCKSNWEENNDPKCKETLTSGDPNDKVGNKGYTPQHYIKSTDQLHYGIFFENVDTATAAAQIVTIIDTLDITKVDKHTFYLESITAGDMLVVLPESIKLQNLDSIYRDTKVNGTYVYIQSTFDTTTGVIKFTLSSLDTTTLQPVTDPLAGFLPPDTSKFYGNGLISYKVLPVANIPGNTVINNRAHIIFDNNEPIATGNWFNTIDGAKPSSHVNPLPAITYDSSFVVSWTGIDEGAGIINYDIYYKRGTDTAFQKWLSSTPLTSARFDGMWDSTYQFYSIAYDSVLNMEDAPLLFDAATTIKKPVQDSVCKNANISFNSDATGTISTYQWQVDDGTGYVNLVNAIPYSGVNTSSLNISIAPTSYYGYKYRCLLDKGTSFDTSVVHILHFVNRWTGVINTAWENIGNWSCNSLPDENTDVIIEGNIINHPIVNSPDAVCRSLSVDPAISFTVTPGNKLSITH